MEKIIETRETCPACGALANAGRISADQAHRAVLEATEQFGLRPSEVGPISDVLRAAVDSAAAFNTKMQAGGMG